MRQQFMLSAITGAAVAALLTFASPTFAASVHLKADLSGASEVPPNQSGAKGTVSATYDTATKELTWKGEYTGLSGPATAAHFHGPADPGKNAGVALALKSATSPLEGSATLTDAQATDLLAGRWYVNIHTSANAGGEIRGQLTKM